MRKGTPRRHHRAGYVSYLLVVGTGLVLTVLMLAAYRASLSEQDIQVHSQLRIDYAEKEEAVLKAIVNLVPNRAMRAMQHQSDANSANRTPLQWTSIFSEALNQANARTSVSTATLNQLGVTGATILANSTDSALGTIGTIFDEIEIDPRGEIPVSPGINLTDGQLGPGFPTFLQWAGGNTKDWTYPIITNEKLYSSAAPGSPDRRFNVIPYPEIHFGYAEPGQPFVAKRNWWGFSMSIGEHDNIVKSYARGDASIGERDFVLSIYEIPSQLAISAEAFTKIGTHADGTPWQQANVEGGVFATRAQVDGSINLDRLSGRRGLSLEGGASVGDNTIDGNPFMPGVREQYEVTHGIFMPVYLSSESGRAAFVPINRGADFFDRFAHGNETSTISPTTWNNYSVGALQCAMQLDIIEISNPAIYGSSPINVRFSYMIGSNRESIEIPYPGSSSYSTEHSPRSLESGYVRVADEGQSYNFSQLVDVAYGANGKFAYHRGVTGTVSFNNTTFGDPNYGTFKAGYYRLALPQAMGADQLKSGKKCVVVYPERIPALLSRLGANSTVHPTHPNHSLVVNVDYTTSGLNNPSHMPSRTTPTPDIDYGVVLKECANLTGFTKGFSLVTNMRLYIGDDFNVVAASSPPAGSGLPAPFYPPTSLFAPEMRYGTDVDPFKVQLSGQMGHLGGDTAEDGPVHLLDLKLGSEQQAGASKINVNLRPITHPAELPPVTMMNWLVVIEEKKKEFYTGVGAN